MSATVLITGSGTGFGLVTAITLAHAGHAVYGGLRGANEEPPESSRAAGVKNVVLDITDEASIAKAVAEVVEDAGHIDCVIHNAGHMCMGPLESFTGDQMHEYFEINAVGSHRLNQAVLPLMRKAGKGHIIWVSSSSAQGGTGPLLGPYFAAKAAQLATAACTALEVACFGIETTIVVPGVFTSGTNHFATAGKPALPHIAKAYMEGPLKGADTEMMENINKTFPPDATPQLVADAILKAVDAPQGGKPFRLAVDPFDDGSDEVMSLVDKKREEFLKRCGIFEICTKSARR